MTPVQLHVWGPAFSLPSLDPQCLAAIAFLSQTLAASEWELIASSDPSCSPTGDLPALQDGSRRIGGFQSIVDHLRLRLGDRCSLDRNLTPQRHADITAFSSFIQSQGQLLLDLSLYVSSTNYHSTTRPTYSSLLSWPHSWILPSQRRIVAKSRTEYLRLSSLDLDAADAARQQQLQQQFPTGTEIPKIIQERQRTALSLLKAPEHAARFRLDALAEDFFKPLDELLADKEWLLGGDEPTSLDCLALGYLALALRPAVPQPWLAESLTKNYPRLHRYVDAVIQHFFGSSIGLSNALPDPFQPTASSLSSPKLPWRTPSWKSLLSTVSEVSSTALENLPLFGNLFKPNPLSPSVAFNDPAASALPLLVPAVALGFISSLVSVVGYGLYSGEVPFSSHWLQGGRRTREKNLRDMGEAGAMLGAVDFGGV